MGRNRDRLSRASVAALFVCTVLATSCAQLTSDADDRARASGFVRQQVQGKTFAHVVYESRLDGDSRGSLHVYIEGDGTPWEHGRFAAADPTPRNPLTMTLMAMDAAPAIYLGRPCYFGLAGSANCSPATWTARRYSQEVVQSMAAVIEDYRARVEPRQLVLVGYSGGGTLATLLAAELGGELFLVTLAANLDTDLWTRHFGLLPLTGSLNPAEKIDRLRHVPQLHLIGDADTRVPNGITTSYTGKLPPEATRTYPNADHACCWAAIWAAILEEQPWAAE